ncbi:EcoKI restriction-modification system protein HsdS [Pseudoalteromonas sp. P1-16-1b]|uniref:restriction endonuclease subunit S n=1 Tax=Pseudoalteromonas sp. P1-16-1b TaxID=1723757 RepID=UPI0006D68D3A|nr:restriction endonuclease subunit S [Pseudoalteromonas sp. P1-16-1b]KPZ65309.1 EcoKI restriction-modification system protein HsdS [Pseudoalteromonas sp. P1-16-1b]
MSEVKIDLNNLDKSNWKTYRFDEIAKNISERVDPNNTDLEVYIGLEHIDSESLHIKRHGTPDDVNGQKLKFYKGDIIFGRRRAYQRKAGIATWDGFCSAHALVLRANPDVIDPELFPFFMHSDLFMNRAIDISVGSLSPTINWGTLKHQEFLIPPISLQEKLSQLFLQLNQSLSEKKNTLDKIRVYKDSCFKYLLEGGNKPKTEKSPLGLLPKGYQVMKVEDFLLDKKGAMKMGPFGSSLKKELLISEGIRVYGQENVFRKDMSVGDRHISKDYFESKLKSCEVFPGDFLISIMGTVGKTMVVPDNTPQGIMDSHLIRLQINKNFLSPELLGYQFTSSLVINQINRLAVGGIMDGLSSGTLKKINFIIPPPTEQIDILDKMSAVKNSEDINSKNIENLKVLQTTISNKVF